MNYDDNVKQSQANNMLGIIAKKVEEETSSSTHNDHLLQKSSDSKIESKLKLSKAFFSSKIAD